MAGLAAGSGAAVEMDCAAGHAGALQCRYTGVLSN